MKTLNKKMIWCVIMAMAGITLIVVSILKSVTAAQQQALPRRLRLFL